MLHKKVFFNPYHAHYKHINTILANFRQNRFISSRLPKSLCRSVWRKPLIDSKAPRQNEKLIPSLKPKEKSCILAELFVAELLAVELFNCLTDNFEHPQHTKNQQLNN